MSLQIQTTRVSPDIAVVQLSGDLNQPGPEKAIVSSAVRDLLQRNQRRVIVDLTGVTTVGSAGPQIIVGILIESLLTVQRAGGELRVAGASEIVARCLKVGRIDIVLQNCYPSVAAAYEGFSISPKTSE